jgi:hypothetical protein
MKKIVFLMKMMTKKVILRVKKKKMLKQTGLMERKVQLTQMATRLKGRRKGALNVKRLML